MGIFTGGARRRYLFAFVCLTITALALLLAGRSIFSSGNTSAANNGPIASAQAVQDGCQRTEVGLLDWHNAQSWVFVGNSANHKVLKGMVLDTRVSSLDLFSQHENRGSLANTTYFYTNHDLNFFVKPDPGYENMLATGNNIEEAEEGGTEPAQTVEIEAAQGEWAYQDNHSEWRDFYDQRVWPTPGDWVELIGSHHWDCGHWDNGERTEMHPPAWEHISRSKLRGHSFNGATPTIAKEHVLFVTSNRQLSGIIANYELTGQTQRQDPLVLNSQRKFYLEAPPKPNANAKLKYAGYYLGNVRLLSNVGAISSKSYPNGKPNGAGAETQPGIEVTVSLQGKQAKPGLPDIGSATKWYVGWDKSSVGLKKVKVTFLRVRCKDDNDPDPGDGEFQMYFRAGNGYYFSYDGGLNDCDDGDGLFDSDDMPWLNPAPSFTQTVPSDQKIRIDVGGYENDDPIPGDTIGRYQADKDLSYYKGWGVASDFNVYYEIKVLESYSSTP